MLRASLRNAAERNSKERLRAEALAAQCAILQEELATLQGNALPINGQYHSLNQQ